MAKPEKLSDIVRDVLKGVAEKAQENDDKDKESK